MPSEFKSILFTTDVIGPVVKYFFSLGADLDKYSKLVGSMPLLIIIKSSMLSPS